MKAFKDISVGSVEELRVEYVRLSDLVQKREEELLSLDGRVDLAKEALEELAQSNKTIQLSHEAAIADQMEEGRKMKRELAEESALLSLEREALESGKDEVSRLQVVLNKEKESQELIRSSLSDERVQLDDEKKKLRDAKSVFEARMNDFADEQIRLTVERASVDALKEQNDAAASALAIKADMIQKKEVLFSQSEASLVERQRKLDLDRAAVQMEKVELSERREALDAERQKVVSDREALEETVRRVDSRDANLSAKENALKYKEGELITWEKDLKVRSTV